MRKVYPLAYNLKMKITTTNNKQNRKNKPLCERHAFSLKPKDDRIIRPHRLSLSFCDAPPKTHKHCISPAEKSCLNCPVVNVDGSHASPAFILHSQRSHYLQERQTLRLEHDLRVRYYSEEKSEMLVPKPKSRNNYCSICRNNYDDYLDHVQSHSHQQKIRKSPFNAHILDLATKAQQQAQIESQRTAQKQIEITQISDSEEVEEVESPRKRVKEDSPTVSHYNHSQMAYFQANSSLNWLTQPSTAQISAYLTQQMALNHYLSMFQTPFPLIPLNQIQTIPYQICPPQPSPIKSAHLVAHAS